MQIKLTSSLSVILASLCVSVSALAKPTPLDVWDPTVLIPNAASAWPAGSYQVVVWDTTNKPAHVTNPVGRLFLRSNFGALNPITPVLLAEGFNNTDGSHFVTIPADTAPRDDYVINLFGDSGNISEEFTIIAA